MRYQPNKISEFIGQDKVIIQIATAIYAAKINDRAIEHILFYGPPGLGKTTLARIIANEMKTNIIELPAAMLKNKNKIDELLLSTIQEKDIVFVDECHNIPKKLEEALYSPLEYFQYGGCPLPQFTFIGATTSAGQLTKPFRDRFLYQIELDIYPVEDLMDILKLHGAKKDVANFIARRSRGIPRLAVNFYKLTENERDIDEAFSKQTMIRHCQTMFNRIEIDSLGLNKTDWRILYFLSKHREPIGISALSLSTNIDRHDLVYIHEPYLLQLEFIRRSPRGRVITREGMKYINEVIRGQDAKRQEVLV